MKYTREIPDNMLTVVTYAPNLHSPFSNSNLPFCEYALC